MVEERVVLVDAQNNPTGTELKAIVHTARTPVHRAFSCFLFSPNGSLLLQQRALSKKTWPGIWSNSCCGHPAPGEETIDAVYRRVAYELGISKESITHLTEVIPEFRYYVEREGIVENEFCPVYVGILRSNSAPNPLEVEATRWIHWSEYVGYAKRCASALTSGVPADSAQFRRYQEAFGSPALYEQSHSSDLGRLSEWSLWETLCLLENETFNTMIQQQRG